MKYETRVPGRGEWLAPAILLAACLAATGCRIYERDTRHALAPLTLTLENVSNRSLYDTRCSDCHEEKPDPANPYCFSGVSADEHVAIWRYEKAMSEGDPSFSPEGKALFESRCDDCHALPDPAEPGCFSVVSEEDVAPIHVYMDDVRRGKELFESDCRSCHEALDPGAHDFGFWSTHLCNADGHLSAEQEQRVLLYLSTRVD